MDYVDVVFDGPPGPVAGRFVEVENSEGASIAIGEWIERPDGLWALRIPTVQPDVSLPSAFSLVEPGFAAVLVREARRTAQGEG